MPAEYIISTEELGDEVLAMGGMVPLFIHSLNLQGDTYSSQAAIQQWYRTSRACFGKSRQFVSYPAESRKLKLQRYGHRVHLLGSQKDREPYVQIAAKDQHSQK